MVKNAIASGFKAIWLVIAKKFKRVISMFIVIIIIFLALVQMKSENICF